MKLTLPKHLDREIVRAIRGKRTQSQFSRLLGFKFNQVYLWESGRRRIYWSDLELICSKLGFSLVQRLKEFFHLRDPESDKIHVLLSASIKGRKKGELAKTLKVTSSKLSRWLSGQSDLPLEAVLNVLALVHLEVLEFVDSVAGVGRIKSIEPAIARAKAVKQAMFSMPFVGAVGAALFTEEYKKLKAHRPGVLASMLGISIAEEEAALKALREAGQLELKDGVYRMAPYQVNLAHDRKQFLKCSQYWSERAAKIIPRHDPKNGFGYRVFAVNEDMVKKVRQAQTDCYNAITEILKNEDGPYDRVMVVNFHSFFPEEKLD